MYIEFDKDYLRELFEQGRTSDKKHRYQPEVIRGYYKCVMFLKRAENVEQLYTRKVFHPCASISNTALNLQSGRFSANR